MKNIDIGVTLSIVFRKSLKSGDRVTPVCTTEIIAFAKANTYFEELNTCLIGLSVDSNPSHLAWLENIYQRTGITIPFPIIADLNGQIARRYGMISNDVNPNVTVRNVFIIDDKGVVRTILIYPMNVGRCIPEILRTVEALQTADKTGMSTPANWTPRKSTNCSTSTNI